MEETCGIIPDMFREGLQVGWQIETLRQAALLRQARRSVLRWNWTWWQGQRQGWWQWPQDLLDLALRREFGKAVECSFDAPEAGSELAIYPSMNVYFSIYLLHGADFYDLRPYLFE